MPLHKVIIHRAGTEVLLWKITEPLEWLRQQANLRDTSWMRLEGMKSEAHQRGFLSVRMLLQERGYTDFDLYYDEFGKPHLKDGTHISISHSHDYSAIILSNENCGIDMEMQREKIVAIAHKFAFEEAVFLNPTAAFDYIRQLTVIWGVKEAIFKIRNEVGISFRDHIHVRPFQLQDGMAKATLNFGNLVVHYDFYFDEVECYTIVYAFEER